MKPTHEVVNWITNNWHTTGTLKECSDYVENSNNPMELDIKQL